MGIYADAELMLYESGSFRALDRDFWRRTAGRTHPSYDPLTCHSGCAPPPKLDWQQVNHAVLLVGPHEIISFSQALPVAFTNAVFYTTVPDVVRI